MKRTKGHLTLIAALMFAVSAFCASAQAAPPDDRDALAGLGTTKALFDINLDSPEKLTLYLRVIRKTHEELARQGLRPTFVIAFRGPSVVLVSAPGKDADDDRVEILQRIASQIRILSEEGVKLEACSIATELMKVDNETVLPEIKVVGNTFLSLIGYQAKGYSIVPIL